MVLILFKNILKLVQIEKQDDRVNYSQFNTGLIKK